MTFHQSTDLPAGPATHTSHRRRRRVLGERTTPLWAVTATQPDRYDPYTTWDAAYVLGSLSAADQREYRAHMHRCQHCRNAVAELRVIAAWLALLDSAEPAASGEHTPVSEIRLPRPPPWTR